MTDDPRLTALAFGELEEEERRAVQAWVASDPRAEAELEDLVEMAALLEDALAHHPDALPAERDASLMRELAALPATETRRPRPVGAGPLAPSRPSVVLAFAVAAATLLALLAGFELDRGGPREARKLWLPAPAAADYFEPPAQAMPLAGRGDLDGPIQCASEPDDSAAALEILEDAHRAVELE